MTQIPRPRGLICSHQTGWAFLTVPDDGHFEQDVQYRLPGADWQPASRQGQRWRVPVREPAVTELRARYYDIVEEFPVYGPWTSARVWTPKGFEEDDEPTAPEPFRPEDAAHRWNTPTEVEVWWAQPGRADGWSVTYSVDGHPTETVQVTEPMVVISDVPVTCSLDVQVRAMKGAAASPPLTMLLPDAMDPGALPSPKNLVVTPGQTTLDVRWAREDVYGEWSLEWTAAGGDPVVAETSGAGQGVVVRSSPRHMIEGLRPATDYLVVVATRYRGTQSRATPTRATTLDNGADHPGTPRLRAGAITASTIEVLWDADPNADQWLVRRDPGHPRHQPTARHRWEATGLTEGREYLFGVIAVNRATGAESVEAVIRLTPATPPPEQSTSAVANLRVGDIGPASASVAWDDGPGPVDLYRVRLEGPEPVETEVIGTSVELHGLLPDQPHVVSVTAVCEGVESRARQVSFTTAAASPTQVEIDDALPAPPGFTVTAPHPELVEAMWDAAPDPNTWWMVSVDGRNWTRVSEPGVLLAVEPGVQRTVELYAVLDGGPGDPVRLSPVVARGVVTATYPTADDDQDERSRN